MLVGLMIHGIVRNVFIILLFRFVIILRLKAPSLIPIFNLTSPSVINCLFPIFLIYDILFFVLTVKLIEILRKKYNLAFKIWVFFYKSLINFHSKLITLP
jgi:hypothetical protein